jgi:hypothetical protein
MEQIQAKCHVDMKTAIHKSRKKIWNKFIPHNPQKESVLLTLQFLTSVLYNSRGIEETQTQCIRINPLL